MIDRLLLFPYYLILGIRHALYNKGFLCKTREAEVPAICIGNITAGGTGKTPHTEMLLRTRPGTAPPSTATSPCR